MGRFLDYDDYAAKYGQTRWAVPWIVDALTSALDGLPEYSTVVDIGCGTGNYAIALSEALPGYTYEGFDRSDGMLAVARERSRRVRFTRGNADDQFPYPAEHCDAAFTVDVIHHIEKIETFFREVARVLKPCGKLLIVTDSEANMRNRSLSRFFPEVLAVELDRYPSLERLHEAAHSAGLMFTEASAAEGTIELDDSFVAKLEEKCSSALRLISSEAHRRGMDKVRLAQRAGETWFSCYTVVRYEKLGKL